MKPKIHIYIYIYISLNNIIFYTSIYLLHKIQLFIVIFKI